MKKLAKKLLVFSVGLLGFVLAAVIGVYLAFYNSTADFMADIDIGKRWVRLELFNSGRVAKLDDDDFRFLYQRTCYRKCHGEEAMITAVLSPAGWLQVVERMRVKEGVKITGLEAEEIIKYLDRTYPTTRSAYSFQVRKKIHQAVWRNDAGQSDIYTDVIYVTPVYLKSIGAEHLIDEYDLKSYDTFIVSFTVHDGIMELFDLDEASLLVSPNGRIKTGVPWELRFQTADKHHFESVVRFKRKKRGKGSPATENGTPWFELEISGVGGAKRVFRYNLPIEYPPEAISEIEAKAEAR